MRWVNPLGIRVDARYRTVAEPRIIEMLLLYGWAFEVRRGEREYAEREASETLNRWVSLGLPFAQAQGGERRFDPAEVINFFKWAGIHRGDPFWEERFIARGRKLILSFHPGQPSCGDPPPPAVLGPERFSVTIRREFNLRSVQPGARTLLRLPLPLEDDALRDLEIANIAPPEVDVDFKRAPGRLDARFQAPRERTLVLGVQASFTAYPTTPAHRDARPAPEEIELYTRPSEGIVEISPRIRALAAELAGAEREPSVLVQRFWSFISDRLTCGVVHYDELDASHPTDWVLESGWFDCHLGSALLVALCRAREIPARLVSGYLIYAASQSYHYWSEIWLDERGWVPFDLVCLDLSNRGRDKPWRDYFVGGLDYRMKTQCLPRLFNLAPSVRFPPAWHVLVRPEGEGTEIAAFANDSGALVYRDQISVRRGGGPPGDSRELPGSASSVNAVPL